MAEQNFDVVYTESGFAMLVNGKQIKVPIGYMRMSEREKLTAFVKEVIHAASTS